MARSAASLKGAVKNAPVARARSGMRLEGARGDFDGASCSIQSNSWRSSRKDGLSFARQSAHDLG